MKSVASVVLAVLSGLASAKVAFTNNAFNVQAGQAFTLNWSGGAGGPYTITLKNGPSGNLKDVETLTSTSAESFTWTPPSTLATDTYAFEITDGADPANPNYSSQFTFAGAAPASSSASYSASSLTSSAVSSTASASSTVTVSSSSAPVTTTKTASASSSASSVSSISSAFSNSTMSSTTLASRTSSSAASRTSSTSASSSTVPSSNDAGVAAPFLAPFLMVAGAVAVAL